MVLWTDEWIAGDSGSELPLYFTTGSGEQAGWQLVPDLLTFAVARFSDAGDANSKQWSVQSTTVLEGVPHVIVLLQRADSNSTRHLFIFDQAGQSWTQGAAIEVNTDSDGQSCEMGMVGTGTGTSELYVWDSHLWYSPDGGLYMHQVSLLQADGSLQAPECIRTLITSEDGQVAVVTADRTLYWGYIGFPYLAEISVLEDDGRTIVSFDMLGQLIARRLSHLSEDVTGVAADTSSGLTSTRVHFHSLPMPHKPAVSDTTGLHACPYQHLTSDLPPTVYLDKGESISATVTVDGGAIGGNAAQAPQLAISSSDFSGQKVHLEINETFTAVGFASLGTTDVTVSASRDFRSHTSADGFEFATVSIRVATSSLHCPADVVSTTGVNVGCPPGRTIRVIHEETECDQQQEPSAADRASAEEWRDESSPYYIDHVSAAGGASMGTTGRNSCAQRMYHGSAPWRPRVVLYDFETPLEDVTVDYIVFERTGRSDYMFNASEAQAGCAATAQTAATLYSGEASYAPCFDPAGGTSTVATDESTSQLYEILNASGVNALKFTTPGGNGRFTFGLRVVDPTFSHCMLETTFLVDVYGAPIDGSTSLAITLTTVGAIACSLVASFVCFRRQADGLRGSVM